MFGSNVNHDQDSQGNVQESRTDDVNNITLMPVYMLP